MPTLDWIGKKAVLNHHHQVPYHLLKDVPDLSVGDPGTGNLIVEGDNLLALKALLPYYAGQVKCIYIDPPYNTGDEAWVYNDNVNSPLIREWLGKTVGKEAEDLSRHDKWLCMMYPRLALLKEFLREDGVLFVSMDETEAGNLRLLLDETFGRDCALGTLVWKRRSPSAMAGTPLSVDHEYVFAYGRRSGCARLYGIEKSIDSYPLQDERGNFVSTDLTVGMGKDARPNQFFPIKNPRTGIVYQPNPERVWRFFPETMEKVIADNLVIWPDDYPDRKMERPRYKTYFNPATKKPKPVSSWIESGSAQGTEDDEYGATVLSCGMNQEGGRILQEILGSKNFAYPKPTSLVQSLIRAATRDDDLVLDSFAGSGTTAHAVLKLNQQEGGARRFILVEMEPTIAGEITAERVKRVTEGYQTNKEKNVGGLGGGFRYCRLGDPLFNERGQIREEVSFGDLARHVYFTETGEPLPRERVPNSPKIGVCRGVAVYLLYNGILGDRTVNGGNVLTRAILATLPPHDGPRIIYGAGCKLGTDRLRDEGITFRQTPYEVRVS